MLDDEHDDRRERGEEKEGEKRSSACLAQRRPAPGVVAGELVVGDQERHRGADHVEGQQEQKEAH